MIRQAISWRKRTVVLLVGVVITCLAIGIERAPAFRGGFGGFGGFHGGFGGFHSFGGGSGGFHGFSGSRGESFSGTRFGDGSFFDRGTDAGFGRGGWGSIHNASSFSEHSGTWDQNHPEWHQNATQSQQNRFNEANQLQQNRSNETNQLQQNRFNDARYLQYNRTNTWNHYHTDWGSYYSGLGLGAGLAIGATMAALPAAAVAAREPSSSTDAAALAEKLQNPIADLIVTAQPTPLSA